MQKIAVLLTCHNRREKTTNCLNSLFACQMPSNHKFDVFLVDDDSTDGTANSIKARFPQVKIIHGNGNLYWAGGMRLAWNFALQNDDFNAFLLLNDDVVILKDCLVNLVNTHFFSLSNTGKSGVYVGSTKDNNTHEVSYGGRIITKNHLLMRSKLIIPSKFPQVCHFANANILWISKEVVEQIGIFDIKFTHGIADFDYTLTAYENKIPLWVAPEIGGICQDDHGNNWLPSKVSLNKRIDYLKSPKGLAYHEYLYYIRKHFPLFYPHSLISLWLRTLAPVLFDQYKK